MSLPDVSVVIATYNRRALLERLLVQLDAQTLPRERYEVVVVDDGSKEPVAPGVMALGLGCAVRVERQENAGAAAARHAGVLLARGALLVFLDDDMQVAPDFLARHVESHPTGTRRVVLGRIRPDPEARMPLFERWHTRDIERLAHEAHAGARRVRGGNMYTGNASLWREDYLAVGGFDHALGHSEDLELGLRLERAGCEFRIGFEAESLHGSDHTSVDKWRRRAGLYGMYDRRIARKHPDLPHANPWRYLFELSPVTRPLLWATMLVPRAARPLATAAYGAAEAADRAGLEKVAMAGTTLAYGLEYFHGLRTEAGPLPRALAEIAAYALGELARSGLPKTRVLALGRDWLEAVRADQACLRHYAERYGHPDGGGERPLAQDLVHKVGLQLLAAYRLMRTLREAGLPLGAKAVSRMIRHLYGSDLHWNADFAPGVMVVHGMGLAVSHAARVEKGCILFQHVTLGMGRDPETGESGAPHLEEGVQVMPGATLLGPIRVGAGTKVGAGVVLTRSVPPRSVLEAPEPSQRERATPRRVTGS